MRAPSGRRRREKGKGSQRCSSPCSGPQVPGTACGLSSRRPRWQSSSAIPLAGRAACSRASLAPPGAARSGMTSTPCWRWRRETRWRWWTPRQRSGLTDALHSPRCTFTAGRWASVATSCERRSRSCSPRCSRTVGRSSTRHRRCAQTRRSRSWRWRRTHPRSTMWRRHCAGTLQSDSWRSSKTARWCRKCYGCGCTRSSSTARKWLRIESLPRCSRASAPLNCGVWAWHQAPSVPPFLRQWVRDSRGRGWGWGWGRSLSLSHSCSLSRSRSRSPICRRRFSAKRVKRCFLQRQAHVHSVTCRLLLLLSEVETSMRANGARVSSTTRTGSRRCRLHRRRRRWRRRLQRPDRKSQSRSRSRSRSWS